MLQSGIGEPYNPETRTGTVGRNYTYQTMTGVDVFYDGEKRINPFMAAGPILPFLARSTPPEGGERAKNDGGYAMYVFSRAEQTVSVMALVTR